MMNGSKPCGRVCEPGLRSIPEIAGSRRPWRSLTQRALSVLFIGLLSCSAPFCPARAHSFVSNPPMIWPDGDVGVVLKLGTPDRTLIDGNTSWEAVAAQALSTWNSHLGTIQFSPLIQNPGMGSDRDGVNQVFFGSRVYGESFGGLVLAVTTIWHDGTTRTEQTVSAIMNSVVSDLDNLTADDINGAQALYPPRTPVITLQPRIESGFFHLKMTGLANRNHIIQDSTDLGTWDSLTTNSVTNGELDFTDTNLVGFRVRFYRALVPP